MTKATVCFNVLQISLNLIDVSNSRLMIWYSILRFLIFRGNNHGHTFSLSGIKKSWAACGSEATGLGTRLKNCWFISQPLPRCVLYMGKCKGHLLFCDYVNIQWQKNSSCWFFKTKTLGLHSDPGPIKLNCSHTKGNWEKTQLPLSGI